MFTWMNDWTHLHWIISGLIIFGSLVIGILLYFLESVAQEAEIAMLEAASWQRRAEAAESQLRVLEVYSQAKP